MNKYLETDMKTVVKERSLLEKRRLILIPCQIVYYAYLLLHYYIIYIIDSIWMLAKLECAKPKCSQRPKLRYAT